jgi:large subunit ribosomal protein L21
MYAVIENGGKQYHVELGAELELDQLVADPGQTIDIGRVLLVVDGDDALIGTPVVHGARVTAEILRPARGAKLIVFKYRPKARRRVKRGHRQELTVVRIADIEFGGRSAAREAQVVADQQERERVEAAKAAETKAKADRALADKLARDKAVEAKDSKAKAAKPAKPAKTESKKQTAATEKTAKPTTKTRAKPTAKGDPKQSARPTAKTAAEPTKGRTRTKKEE